MNENTNIFQIIHWILRASVFDRTEQAIVNWTIIIGVFMLVVHTFVDRVSRANLSVNRYGPWRMATIGNGGFELVGAFSDE